MSNETIEQKAKRLLVAACKVKEPFNPLIMPPPSVRYSVSIFNMVQLVELAIAEEREACVQKAALWALTKELASAIRGRTADPKDEVPK